MAAHRTYSKSVIPGFGLTLGVTLSMLSVLILIPLLSVLGFSFTLSPSEFAAVIAQPAVARAFATSIGCALVAALVNAVFGLILAWVLTRYRFPGRRILDGLIELPFALPTAVAGITLSKMFVDTGEIGGPLAALGIEVAYTHLGIIVALIFVGVPFVVRTVQPVLEDLDGQMEEAAHMLGASRLRTFFKVILPELLPPLLAGFGLALARGIGEYGSVIYISGNSAKNGTQVVSYIIMQKLNGGAASYDEAAAVALVLLVISFILLFGINFVQNWAAHRAGDATGVRAEASPAATQGNRAARILFAALAVLFIVFVLVLPLFSVIAKSLVRGFEFYVQAVSTKYVVSALRVTLTAAVITVVVNTFFGLVASWLLTKYRFRGQRFLGTLIDIPFSISPVIAGLAFVMTFGRMGWAAPALDAINNALGTDIALVFSVPGVVLATIFVTFPFVSRELVPVMNSQGNDEEEAAALMGASGFRIFREVTFPKIKWALLYGVVLCAARAIGEFGAVSALSKTRGATFTLPLEVDALYMNGSSDSITAAFAVSSILVIIALVILVLRQVIETRAQKRESR
ncbi:MAG: sulfate ABC transporter permease subunit CysT [Coriobacteriales bacterium]